MGTAKLIEWGIQHDNGMYTVRELDKIVYCEHVLFASVYEWEKAEWLAHILSLFVPEYYKFITVPSLLKKNNSYNICFVYMGLPEGDQVLGYVLPAKYQPLLAQYMEDADVAEQEPDDRGHSE